MHGYQGYRCTFIVVGCLERKTAREVIHQCYTSHRTDSQGILSAGLSSVKRVHCQSLPPFGSLHPGAPGSRTCVSSPLLPLKDRVTSNMKVNTGTVLVYIITSCTCVAKEPAPFSLQLRLGKWDACNRPLQMKNYSWFYPSINAKERINQDVPVIDFWLLVIKRIKRRLICVRRNSFVWLLLSTFISAQF